MAPDSLGLVGHATVQFSPLLTFTSLAEGKTLTIRLPLQYVCPLLGSLLLFMRVHYFSFKIHNCSLSRTQYTVESNISTYPTKSNENAVPTYISVCGSLKEIDFDNKRQYFKIHQGYHDLIRDGNIAWTASKRSPGPRSEFVNSFGCSLPIYSWPVTTNGDGAHFQLGTPKLSMATRLSRTMLHCKSANICILTYLPASDNVKTVNDFLAVIVQVSLDKKVL